MKPFQNQFPIFQPPKNISIVFMDLRPAALSRKSACKRQRIENKSEPIKIKLCQQKDKFQPTR